jgi:cell fate regulator YaaT (PSP1 superfamily)
MNKPKQSYFFARVFADTNLYKVKITSKHEFIYGAEIVIETEFGKNIAVITSFETTNESSDVKNYISGNLIRYATDEDKLKRKTLDKKSLTIKAKTNSIISDLKLEMNLTHVLVGLSEEAICIYYTSNGRVDFRGLLTQLRQAYKYKITLRQITPNQRKSSFLFSSDLSSYGKESYHTR